MPIKTMNLPLGFKLDLEIIASSVNSGTPTKNRGGSSKTTVEREAHRDNNHGRTKGRAQNSKGQLCWQRRRDKNGKMGDHQLRRMRGNNEDAQGLEDGEGLEDLDESDKTSECAENGSKDEQMEDGSDSLDTEEVPEQRADLEEVESKGKEKSVQLTVTDAVESKEREQAATK